MSFFKINTKKYKCEKCGFEKHSSKVKVIIFSVFAGIFLALALIGSLGIWNSVIANEFNEDLMFSLGGLGSAYENIVSSLISPIQNEDIVDISVKLTKDCETDLCKIIAIKNYLDDFDYEVGTNIFNYEKLIEEQEIDCDEGSSLAKFLLRGVGIKSRIVTNHNHAWLIVYTDEGKYRLDIAGHRFEKVK